MKNEFIDDLFAILNHIGPIKVNRNIANFGFGLENEISFETQFENPESCLLSKKAIIY